MELLDRTAAILRDKGWHQGSSMNKRTGAVCLGQAMASAHEWRRLQIGVEKAKDEYTRAYRHVIFIIRSRMANHSYSIPDWNDHRAKDVDEVLEVVKLASEAADLELAQQV